MIFIGGISQGQKILNYGKTMVCRRCGSYGRYEVFMTYMYFSFFFIPLFKWSKKFYVRMTCCGALYQLDQEVGMMILKGQDVEITPKDLTLIQEGKGGWENQASQSGENSQKDKTLRCPICGYEAQGDFNYCPKCGQRLQ